MSTNHQDRLASLDQSDVLALRGRLASELGDAGVAVPPSTGDVLQDTERLLDLAESNGIELPAASHRRAAPRASEIPPDEAGLTATERVLRRKGVRSLAELNARVADEGAEEARPIRMKAEDRTVTRAEAAAADAGLRAGLKRLLGIPARPSATARVLAAKGSATVDDLRSRHRAQFTSEAEITEGRTATELCQERRLATTGR